MQPLTKGRCSSTDDAANFATCKRTPMIRVWIIVLVVSAVSGCSQGPSHEEAKSADYGQPQTPMQCAAAVERRFETVLKDAESARYQHEPCFKGFLNSVPIAGFPVTYGYVQTGKVNARNSFGGYVGFRPYQAVIKNGLVVRYCISNGELCIPAR